MSHLDYWHPSDNTLKYRVRWYAGKIYHKDFPPTDKGLIKLAKWFKEQQLPMFGAEILVLKKIDLRFRGEKQWIRLPYSMPITAVLGYLKDKNLLEVEPKQNCGTCRHWIRGGINSGRGGGSCIKYNIPKVASNTCGKNDCWEG